MKWPWSKPKEKKQEWWLRCYCGYEMIFTGEKPKECPKCGLKDEIRKLQCKYCGAIMEEGRHSACEHSNSAYDYIEGE